MLKNAISENFSPEDNVIVELVNNSNGDLNLRIKRNKLVKKFIYRSYTRSGNELVSFAQDAKINLAAGTYQVPLKEVLKASKNLAKVVRFVRNKK